MINGEFPQRKSLAATHPENYDYLINSASIHGDMVATRIDTPLPLPKHRLPEYLKPLPQRMTSIDIDYLFAKGALSIPATPVRNALLRAYFEFVHPYMPLMEMYDFLQAIEDGDGHNGNISLLLFQSVMFAGAAFVDMGFLRSAGYSNRKAARKAFFQKARVCIFACTLGKSDFAGPLRL